MSDLAAGGTGRAGNGMARTGGPVPVPVGAPSAAIRTPRDVMRDRHAREARRQEAMREEEQQKKLAEERRRSMERRAVTATSGTTPRFSHSSPQYNPDESTPQATYDTASERSRSRVAGEVAGSNVLGDPTGRAGLTGAAPRARRPSVSQTDQPRPAPTSVGQTRRTQPVTSAKPSQQQTAGATPVGAPPPSAPATAAGASDGSHPRAQSSFPHAFERWETLSSHWEGLTSYWLHKLEQNTEEIREVVPNATTLNRQITDLSAAGANLFHAVVELQRLRASSERKFQRWFFETRADNERNREVQASLERQLRLERQAREDNARSQDGNSAAVENAMREVKEMKRELMISKDEARRAWEELGRRNQESLDTAQSLRDGKVTLVSGVQVTPWHGGSGTASQMRPVTREGQSGYGGPMYADPAEFPSPGGDAEYYYRREDGPSPTITDPFADSGRNLPRLLLDDGQRYLASDSHQRYPSESAAPPVSAALASTMHASTHPSPASSAAGAGAIAATSPPSRRSPAAASAGAAATPSQAHHAETTGAGPLYTPQITVRGPEEQQLYRHGVPTTSLHSGSSSQGTGAAQANVSRPPPTLGPESRSDPSYVPSSSEADPEYAVDLPHEPRRDDDPNHPIVFRMRGAGPERSSESEDDFDTDEAVRREQELSRMQQSGSLLPEAPSVPNTAAQAMATYGPTAAAAAATAAAADHPDYEGDGFDGYQQFLPRHYHPTRLSDVLEEDEERSSRRTGPD